MTTNDPRQETSEISITTKGGVTVLPSRLAAWVMPCAEPDLPPGSQDDMARVAVGKVAPSPRPSSIRTRISDHSPLTSPVSIVAAAQTSPHTVSVRRAPNRSPNQPPATWHAR